MKTKLLIFFFLFTGLSFAQEPKLISLKNTEQFVLESEYFKDEPFTIQVCLPKNYDKAKDYPVVYLLDADKSIGMAKEIADWLMFQQEINDILIVGIAYNKDDDYWWINRSRDFCPTLDTISAFGKYWPKAGGADKFLDFMQYDLKPEIEKRYIINKTNTGIIGFSFGGLLASYALFTRSDLFENYIIISPALIWDNLLITRLENKYFQANKELDKKVFISLSSNDSNDLVNEPTKKFIEILKTRKYDRFDLTYDYYENETHFSGYPRALTTGLKKIYLTD